MSDLRKKLVKLAYEKPDLRPALLPILKEAASKSRIKEVLEEAIFLDWMQYDVRDYLAGKVGIDRLVRESRVRDIPAARDLAELHEAGELDDRTVRKFLVKGLVDLVSDRRGLSDRDFDYAMETLKKHAPKAYESVSQHERGPDWKGKELLMAQAVQDFLGLGLPTKSELKYYDVRAGKKWLELSGEPPDMSGMYSMVDEYVYRGSKADRAGITPKEIAKWMKSHGAGSRPR